MPYREQQSRVTATLDGTSLGVWDNKTGGDQGSSSSQYQLGGMGKQISLGGSIQVTNVIVQVLQDGRIEGVKKFIRSRVGKGILLISEQGLDDEGDPFGPADHWQGRLIRAKSADANQGSNAAKMFEMEAEIDGEVS